MTIAVSAIRRALARPRWPTTTMATTAAVRLFHASSIWAAHKILRPFRLADIGEGITECEVIKWSVKPSATVQMFDPLCEVQSDKASVEITSPFDGVVKELLVKEGDVAKVGESLCIIEVESEGEGKGEGSTTEAAPTSQSQSAPDRVQEVATEEPKQPLPSPTTSTPPAARALHPLDPRAQSQAVAERPTTGPVEVLALPAVRHFAKQIGIDLSLLAPGSGKGGRVERKDVEEFVARGRSGEPASVTEHTPQAPKAGDHEANVIIELGRTRHVMWRAMEKSLEIPHFGYSTYLDLTNIHNLLPIFNQHIPRHYLANPPEERLLMVNPAALYPPPPPPDVPSTGKYTRITYLPILLKTLSRAMTEWPVFRSSITPRSPPPSIPADNSNAITNAKPTLTLRPHSDISIALSTPTGLYTPTITHTNTQSIYALASRLTHFAALGRRVPNCGLGPAEMPKSGGTITVSNVGAVGQGEFASPVLVPGGGVAIVAIGRARWVRVENEGEREEDVFEAFGVERIRSGGGRGKKRLRVGVSWSADHRVVEGAELAAFVETWRGYVEHPERLIADSV